MTALGFLKTIFVENEDYERLLTAIRAQHRIRMIVAFPVSIALFLTAAYLHSANSQPSVLFYITFSLYCIYMLGLIVVLRRFPPRRVSTLNKIVWATEMLDPSFLSLALYFAGPSVDFFSMCHIFTTLGYGARYSKYSMWRTHVFAMVSFFVLLHTSLWAGKYYFGLTLFLILAIVPIYGSLLMGELRKEANDAWRKEAKARASALEALDESIKSQHLAEEESRAKSRLLAKVSHEMRTPLTSIVSCNELLSKETDNPKILELSSYIRHLADSLNFEISQLLDFARYRDGGFRQESRVFVLKDLERLLADRFIISALDKDLDFSIRVDPRLDFDLLVDTYGLNTVLNNLVANAIKFTAKGSVTVIVSLLEDDKNYATVRFSVIDTGIGIAPEHQALIFDEFYQVSEGRNRKYDGYGLGMSLAKKILSGMGSTVSLNSDPGQGTNFSFVLKLIKSAKVGSGENSGIEYDDFDAAKNKQILVVEDNRMISKMITLILGLDGHNVYVAADGNEGLSQLFSDKFDMVFLDYHMPDMDGIEMLDQYFERTPQSDRVPVYFLTADASNETREQLMAAGATDVLHKPFNEDDLRRAVAEACLASS